VCLKRQYCRSGYSTYQMFEHVDPRKASVGPSMGCSDMTHAGDQPKLGHTKFNTL
jgi:hypothetical protein